MLCIKSGVSLALAVFCLTYDVPQNLTSAFAATPKAAWTEHYEIGLKFESPPGWEVWKEGQQFVLTAPEELGSVDIAFGPLIGTASMFAYDSVGVLNAEVSKLVHFKRRFSGAHSVRSINVGGRQVSRLVLLPDIEGLTAVEAYLGVPLEGERWIGKLSALRVEYPKDFPHTKVLVDIFDKVLASMRITMVPPKVLPPRPRFPTHRP